MFSKDETVKVKGIAILLLMFHHLFYNADRVAQSGMRFLWFSEEQIQPIAIAARICVWIFVFLSAYGLTYSYNKNRQTETTLQFMVKHWLSLMKTYWVVYIVIFVAYFAIVGNPFANKKAQIRTTDKIETHAAAAKTTVSICRTARCSKTTTLTRAVG